MSFEIRDLNGGVGVIITGEGVVTEKEYVDVLVKHLTQDETKFKKYRYSLSDYTAVTEIIIPTEAIELIATYCESASKVNPKPVIALVADQDLIFGLSRMWELLIDATEWVTGVFRKRDDAEAWITQNVKEKYGIDGITFD
jgi:hypothetical protein